ncbi:hypothetical protein ACFORO_23380 [Amycolatopsis halotolerans]|uniref:Secreted protein n=1 Tax=Amycolatopsis halotolerans TaxID=330083 RepID=A0ABV7QMK5_9PSEU
MFYLVVAAAASAATAAARPMWCLFRLSACVLVRLVEQKRAVRLAEAVLESGRDDGDWQVRAGGLDVSIRRRDQDEVGGE